MTRLLEEAIRKARALSEEKQDHLAATLLEEIARDEQWEETLASPESLALLDGWAAEALQDLREGRTEPLDPETL